MDLKNTNAQRIYEKKNKTMYTGKARTKKAYTQNIIHDKKGGSERTTKRGAVTRTQKSCTKLNKTKRKREQAAGALTAAVRKKAQNAKKQMPFKMVQKFLWRLRVRSGRMNPMRDPPHFFGLSFLFCKKDAPVVASHSGLQVVPLMQNRNGLSMSQKLFRVLAVFKTAVVSFESQVYFSISSLPEGTVVLPLPGILAWDQIRAPLKYFTAVNIPLCFSCAGKKSLRTDATRCFGSKRANKKFKKQGAIFSLREGAASAGRGSLGFSTFFFHHQFFRTNNNHSSVWMF